MLNILPFFKIKITGFTDIQNKVLCDYLVGPGENFFLKFYLILYAFNPTNKYATIMFFKTNFAFKISKDLSEIQIAIQSRYISP